MEESTNYTETAEYIRLSKKTKGYCWEIKINNFNVDKLVEIDNKLKKIYNAQM